MGEGARYFQSPRDIDEILDSLNVDPAELLAMENASRRRYREAFTRDQILTAYEKLLLRFAPAVPDAPLAPCAPDVRVMMDRT